MTSTFQFLGLLYTLPSALFLPLCHQLRGWLKNSATSSSNRTGQPYDPQRNLQKSSHNVISLALVVGCPALTQSTFLILTLDIYTTLPLLNALLFGETNEDPFNFFHGTPFGWLEFRKEVKCKWEFLLFCLPFEFGKVMRSDFVHPFLSWHSEACVSAFWLLLLVLIFYCYLNSLMLDCWCYRLLWTNGRTVRWGDIHVIHKVFHWFSAGNKRGSA